MPFGPYKDMKDCINKNKDKKSPGGYCAVIHKRITGKWPSEKEQLSDNDIKAGRLDVLYEECVGGKRFKEASNYVKITPGRSIPFENLPQKLKKILKLNPDGSIIFEGTRYDNIKDLYEFELRNDYSRKGFSMRYGFSHQQFLKMLKNLI